MFSCYAVYQDDDGHFAPHIIHLELFISHKNLVRQIHAYKDIKARFYSSYPAPTVAQGVTPSHGVLARINFSGLEPGGAELQADQHECAALDALLYEHDGRNDTTLYVLAILRRVSLEILHSATGWQTTKSQQLRSKAKFCDFVAKDGATARRCLLHAYHIFQASRGTTLGASYGVFNLMVAVGYIYCFIELCTGESPPPTGSDSPAKPRLVRLDQLRDKKSIDEWIDSNTKSVVLMTGVGLLNGPEACVRFLRDVEQTLLSQVAWSGICQAFAGSFAQLRRGETPTKKSGDPKEPGKDE